TKRDSLAATDRLSASDLAASVRLALCRRDGGACASPTWRRHCMTCRHGDPSLVAPAMARLSDQAMDWLVAVVIIAPTWLYPAGDAATAAADPGALRLSQAGIPTAHATAIGGNGLRRRALFVGIHHRRVPPDVRWRPVGVAVRVAVGTAADSQYREDEPPTPNASLHTSRRQTIVSVGGSGCERPSHRGRVSCLRAKPVARRLHFATTGIFALQDRQPCAAASAGADRLPPLQQRPRRPRCVQPDRIPRRA